MNYVDAILSSDGDIRLAAERLTTPDKQVNEYEVRQGFIDEITTNPSKAMSIRASGLLMMIQLMSELRTYSTAVLAEASPNEILKALDLVMHAIAELSAPAAITSEGNTTNIFNGSDVVDRLVGRLAAMNRPELSEAPIHLVEANGD